MTGIWQIYIGFLTIFQTELCCCAYGRYSLCCLLKCLQYSCESATRFTRSLGVTLHMGAKDPLHPYLFSYIFSDCFTNQIYGYFHRFLFSYFWFILGIGAFYYYLATNFYFLSESAGKKVSSTLCFESVMHTLGSLSHVAPFTRSVTWRGMLLLVCTRV